jgi:hypothetical protein
VFHIVSQETGGKDGMEVWTGKRKDICLAQKPYGERRKKSEEGKGQALDSEELRLDPGCSVGVLCSWGQQVAIVTLNTQQENLC